jgi:hypothetical protein
MVLIDNVRALISDKNYTAAASLLGSILPEGQFEIDQHTVTAIYFKLQQLNYTLTSSDIDQLTVIANKNSYSNGSAVISARIMLDLDIEDSYPNNERRGLIETDSGISMAKAYDHYFFYGKDGMPVDRLEIINLAGQKIKVVEGYQIPQSQVGIGNLIKATIGDEFKVFRDI